MIYDACVRINLMKYKRQVLGLTQIELANQAGINRATVCRIENGREEPSSSQRERLARALQIDPAQLTQEVINVQLRGQARDW